MDTQVYFISLHFDIILLTVLYSVMNYIDFLLLIRGITGMGYMRLIVNHTQKYGVH